MTKQATGRLVVVEPIQDPLETESGIALPDSYREAHVQCGWVRSVGESVQERISEGDLVVFLGWQEIGISQDQYAPWPEHEYALDERDIECVIEEW